MPFKTQVSAALLLAFSLLQGCMVWIPMDVDYDVEIELSDNRPDLKTDVGFIHYNSRYGQAWGYWLYCNGVKTNQLSVFLFPQELCKGSWGDFAASADVSYPKCDEPKSFQDIDLGEFTNSVRSVFDREYRLHKREDGSVYVGECGASSADRPKGVLLWYSSSWHVSGLDEDNLNAAMEHTLQAVLLRAKYAGAPALHERRVEMKKRMLYTHPRFPVTTIEKITCGACYQLWTDQGEMAGSLTVRYPFYKWTIAGLDGEREAVCAAMAQFLTMYCDRGNSGKYKGVVTSYIKSPQAGPVRAEVGEFTRVRK